MVKSTTFPTRFLCKNYEIQHNNPIRTRYLLQTQRARTRAEVSPPEITPPTFDAEAVDYTQEIVPKVENSKS